MQVIVAVAVWPSASATEIVVSPGPETVSVLPENPPLIQPVLGESTALYGCVPPVTTNW
ncbi:MAG: hypothetical protein KJ018_08860 [Burkholderiales bacterium]|nr:hypothetical protein [Burkholderiales bacterium]